MPIMLTTLSTLHIKTPTKVFDSPPKIYTRVHNHNRSFSLTCSSPTTAAKLNPLNKLRCTQSFNLYGRSKNNFDGFSSRLRRLAVNAQDKSGFVKQTYNDDDKSERDELEARGESTMPERFRYLTKEGTDKPVRWPLLIVLAFMLYTWRTVLWELSNWKKVVTSISKFVAYIVKLLLALLFQFIGNPLTSLIRAIETTLYTIRAFYSSIIAYAPIKELTLIILLTSTVLAIAEATVPDSVNSQTNILTVAGLIGFLAVRSHISELFFWTLLAGLFVYGRIVKKRDYVSSTLPVAAALVAVGEPWVRVVVMACFVALAVSEHSKKSRLDVEEGKDSSVGNGIVSSVPIPLLCAGLAIGIRVAAKWAGYRHLTWMIV